MPNSAENFRGNIGKSSDWKSKSHRNLDSNRVLEYSSSLRSKELAFFIEEGIYLEYPCLAIPLFPLMGVDKETVLDNLLIQTDGIIGILEEFAN